MASKRSGIPKSKPALYFEQVPLELVKEVAKTTAKKRKMRLAARRSTGAGR